MQRDNVTTARPSGHVLRGGGRSIGRAGFLWAFALVAAATGVTVALGLTHLSEADIVMIYLAVIMACAARMGRGPAVLASALSVLAFDFFFVEPFHTLSVEDPRNVLTFVMLFVVGLFVSALTHRLQNEAVARRNEETKSALLSAVSHDLRTPLATILGAATTLKAEGERIPAPDRRALLESIEGEATALERLVASLLDMTRLEGAVVLRRDWVPLEELIGSALARTERALEPRSVAVDLDPKLPLLHVDAALLEQTLVNLLDNAAKHTPPETHVEIRARADARGAVTLELSDDGPGLPEGVDVFARFVRGPHAARGGVGLGLAICRAVMTAHGGTLDALPREGRGTRFFLTLPPSVPPPAMPPAPPGMRAEEPA